MPKTLDPNHLQLMRAAADAVKTLRRIDRALSCFESTTVIMPMVRVELGAVIDKLRLAVKGKGK